jgi:hypothetical protein
LADKRDVRKTSKVVFGWMTKEILEQQAKSSLADKRDVRTTNKVVFGWMTKEI